MPGVGTLSPLPSLCLPHLRHHDTEEQLYFPLLRTRFAVPDKQSADHERILQLMQARAGPEAGEMGAGWGRGWPWGRRSRRVQCAPCLRGCPCLRLALLPLAPPQELDSRFDAASQAGDPAAAARQLELLQARVGGRLVPVRRPVPLSLPLLCAPAAGRAAPTSQCPWACCAAGHVWPVPGRVPGALPGGGGGECGRFACCASSACGWQ